MMKYKLISLAVLFAILSSLVLPVAASTALAQTDNPLVGIPIVGDIAGGGTFEGTFDVTRFAIQNGQIVAVGNLSGTLTDAAGAVIGTIEDVVVALPVGFGSSTCEILELTLGPLDLNLLGLMVHLDQVHLEITAQQGGGLLGDLLCAIANLLDNDTPLRAVINLLNQILNLLG
jgi:hypothetical protein